MLDVAEARARLLEQLIPPALDAQLLPLAEAAGRLCAIEVPAISPSPPYRRAMMDGYALRAADLPGPLPVAFEVPAGSALQRLPQGQCARIFTGAPVPEGADCVIPQENLISQQGGVTLQSSPQTWIRPAGDDIQLGQRLVSVGQKLGPAELGLLASGGHADVPVQQPLSVRLLTTGDEVRELGVELESGQIYNSNATSLSAMLRGWGVSVTHQHVPDDPQAMRDALKQAAADQHLILTVGGVSVGDHDHVRPAIEALGSIDSFKVRMQPGKPFAFGQIDGVPVCCLPGNPASSMVTAMLFVRPAIQTLSGQSADLTSFALPVKFTVPATERRRFLRVRWVKDGMTLHPNQDSGSLSPLVWATGLCEIPEHTAVNRGDVLNYYPFAELI